MPCFSPLKGYRSKVTNENGKTPLVFNPKHGYIDKPVDVPCGQCIGCRLERSRQWTVRIMHEASLHDSNCFITLTYSDEKLPGDGSLCLDDFQRFMKRLRKEFHDSTIRFFHCGEYGSLFSRPHYHACLFGVDLCDRRSASDGKGHNELISSPLLERLWPYGFNTVGPLTYDSAAYVARYIIKKVTGQKAANHYSVVNSLTGEVVEVLPEYVTMSRRPGIGADWFDMYKREVYCTDTVVMRGREMKPPKFYDYKFELFSPAEFAKVKLLRKANAKEVLPERLLVKEKVVQASLNLNQRSYEQNG